MTNLELALASILEAMEAAKKAGNFLLLGALLQRKDTICAALAAPEHSWHVPQAFVPNTIRRHYGHEEKAVA